MNGIKSLIDNVVYLDIETTGLSDSLDDENMRKWERIIEIGAVKYKDGEYSEFHTLVNPRKKLSLDILDLCSGISQDALDKSPTIKDIFPCLVDFIEDMPLICHNAAFEKKFLSTYGKALGYELKNEFLDSMELAALVNPGLKEYNLEALIKEYIKPDLKEQHRGLEDAKDTIKVVNKILEDLWIESSMVLPHEFSNLDDWNWIKYIEPHAVPLYERPLRKEKHVPIIPVDYDKYEQLFMDEQLWRRTGRSYSIRKQQIDVSEKVKDCLVNGNVTLVEAPTGIGKSLAYLLPSVIYSYKTGAKIVISTNTKGLQTQLVEKDIPNLLDILSLRNNINYVSMKGKNNYLCMDRIKLMDLPISLEERMGYVYLYRSAFIKNCGDIEDINYWVRNHFEIDKIVDECSCDSEYCDIKSCEYKEQCFYAKEVEKLKEANIIIINHSLLLKWPYRTEVEIKNLIVDEAHNLKKEVYSAFECEVTSKDIMKNLRDIYAPDYKSGYLLYLGRKYKDIYDASVLNNHLKNIIISIQNISDSFECYIKERSNGKEKELIYDIKECINIEDKKFSNVRKSMEQFVASLTVFNIEINKSLERLQCNEGLKNDKRLKILAEKVKNMDTIKDVVESCIKQQMANYCYSYDVHKGFKWWSIKYTPLDVSNEFYSKVVDPLESGMFISATLTSRGNYDDFKSTLGIDKCLENKKKLVEVPAIDPVFNYKKNSTIYAPVLQSDPKALHEFVAEAAQFVLNIVDTIEGNILMLFTSKVRLNEFERCIRKDIEQKGIRLLTRKKDIDKLKKREERYIFLGSRGFFEGVDIPGDAMNTIILDKVPNINGKEPLYETLIKRLEKDDDRYFTYYNMINYPIVAIDIKQIYGRLMRTEYDYGSFIILSKFERDNQNTKRLNSELYSVSTVRGDSRIIAGDIRRKYDMWKKNNMLKIFGEVKNQIRLAKNIEEAEGILQYEYEKRNLKYEVSRKQLIELKKFYKA